MTEERQERQEVRRGANGHRKEKKHRQRDRYSDKQTDRETERKRELERQKNLPKKREREGRKLNGIKVDFRLVKLSTGDFR